MLSESRALFLGLVRTLQQDHTMILLELQMMHPMFGSQMSV